MGLATENCVTFSGPLFLTRQEWVAEKVLMRPWALMSLLLQPWGGGMF